MEEAFNDESPATSLSSEVFSEKEWNQPTPKVHSSEGPEADLFIGGATEKEAEKKIGFWGFVIYYLMPDDIFVPFSIPLKLAYRSSQEGYFHFSISEKKHYDYHRKITRSMFKVDCGDFTLVPCDNRRLIPGFFSLEALIKHYKTFAYHDAEKGVLETFPIGRKSKK